MQTLSDADPLAFLSKLPEDSFEAGIVNIIDVSTIRAFSGARWPRRREQVHDHVLKSFRKRTRASDSIFALSEVKFLAVQPGATQAAAIASCGNVAQDTLQYFLGAEVRAPIAVSQLTGIVDGVLQARALDEQTVLGAMSASRRPNADETAAAAALPQWQAIASKLERRVKFVVQVNPKIEAALRLDPIWNTKRGAVAAFVISTVIFGEHEGNISPIRLADLEARPALTLALRMVDFAADAIASGRGNARPFGLHLPLSIHALATSRERAELVKRLQQLQPADRSMILFEIADCPSGAPQSRVLDLVALLKPYCRGVIARVADGQPPPRSWLQTGLAGVGMIFDGTETLGEHASQRLVTTFTDVAAAHKIIVCHGLRKRALVLAAWANGATHVSGQIISDEIAGGPRALVLTHDDIFVGGSEKVLAPA